MLYTPNAYSQKFSSVPTLAEWEALWSLWDSITLGMIPEGMLHTKPIYLRHKCLFYIGHIPTFLDIHLTRVLRKVGKRKELEGHTEPERFKYIFERGIDPDVDDPSVIHPHSAVPECEEDWPRLDEVLEFRDKVRARLRRVYKEHETPVESENGSFIDFPRELGRVLWMTWEHEGLHVETLLWMLIQKAGEQGGSLPPPGLPVPQWDLLVKSNPGWLADLPPADSVIIGEEGCMVFLGHVDIEKDDKLYASSVGHTFGWDNESPLQQVQVKRRVRMETRPVTNIEYHRWWVKHPDAALPAQWAKNGKGDVEVRTLFGPVSLDGVARNWPFIGSYDELHAFAKSKGGRLPTEPELRLYADLYDGEIGERNVGFKNWHPIPPKVPHEGERGHNGGVWEWTSTVWEAHKDFEPSVLYPGFSADFFDGKHNVVLFGSYASLPRISQRRSTRNWFQRNYPFPWVGGRIAYDV